MEYLEALLAMVANGAIIIFEFMGVGIIIYSGFTGFIKFLHKAPETKIYLAKGLAWNLKWGAKFSAQWWCASGRRSELWRELSRCGPH